MNATHVALIRALGLTGIAAVLGLTSLPKSEAACYSCFVTIRPDGSSQHGCRSIDSGGGSMTEGPTQCYVTSSGCTTFGYGSCS